MPIYWCIQKNDKIWIITNLSVREGSDFTSILYIYIISKIPQFWWNLRRKNKRWSICCWGIFLNNMLIDFSKLEFWLLSIYLKTSNMQIHTSTCTTTWFMSKLMQIKQYEVDLSFAQFIPNLFTIYFSQNRIDQIYVVIHHAFQKEYLNNTKHIFLFQVWIQDFVKGKYAFKE